VRHGAFRRETLGRGGRWGQKRRRGSQRDERERTRSRARPARAGRDSIRENLVLTPGSLTPPSVIHYPPAGDRKGIVRAAAGPETISMMQETGWPAGQRARMPALRAAVLATVLVSTGFAVHSVPAATESSERDSALERSIQMITNAFSSEKAEPLAALVPADGKVLIAMMSVGGGAGYYSRDQVYFIFKKVFTQHDTVRFDLRNRRQAHGENDPEKHGDSPVFVYCTGFWSYHRHDGVDGEMHIHFILSMKKGTWSLVEIREVQ
jgi:hypothetical protein